MWHIVYINFFTHNHWNEHQFKNEMIGTPVFLKNITTRTVLDNVVWSNSVWCNCVCTSVAWWCRYRWWIYRKGYCVEWFWNALPEIIAINPNRNFPVDRFGTSKLNLITHIRITLLEKGLLFLCHLLTAWNWHHFVLFKINRLMKFWTIDFSQNVGIENCYTFS